MKERLVFLVLLFLFLIRPIGVFNQHKQTFLSHDYTAHYEQYKTAYYNSQYVKKNKPAIIPDETFEDFAAGAFLRGLNPILIVHDHPPLGRYILALSIFLFNNPATILIPLMLLSCVGLYLIGYGLMGNPLLALIPVGIFINEPLFLDKLVYAPLPEPVQLPFIIYTFFFFLRAIKSKRALMWFLSMSIGLGFVISTRFFITGAVMTVVFLLSLLIIKSPKKTIVKFLISLPLSVLVLFCAYTRTIMAGASIIKVIAIQKYILAYHKSLFILPFSFWDLFLFNRWHTWWGSKQILHDSDWFFLWPIAFIVMITCLIISLLKKRKMLDGELVLILWILVYATVLSVGYTSTRYFLPIVPFLYIVTVSLLKRVIPYLIRRYEKHI